MSDQTPPSQPRKNSEFFDQYLIDVAHERGIHLSPDDAQELDLIGELHNVGYEDKPRLLAESHAAGRLSPAALNYLVPMIWRNRTDPDLVTVETWRDLFDAVDYTHNFVLARRPRWQVRLYRGATDANRCGLSWT